MKGGFGDSDRLLRGPRLPGIPAYGRTTLKLLHSKGIPIVALQLIALCYAGGLIPEEPWHDCVEYFAGAKAITHALRGRGLRAESFELKDDADLQDMLGTAGFINAVLLIMRMAPGGMAWFGIVCS